MSTSQANSMLHQAVAQLPKLTDQPLTPPLTNKEPCTEAARVIALFKQIYAGSYPELDARTEFQLADGEYDVIVRTLQQDDELWGYVDDKIRYDYDKDRRRLVVRRATEIQQHFINAVEDDIRSQLKTIQAGSGKKAEFAQKVHCARSTEIRFDDRTSKYEPDALFWHERAQYPGIIFEVAYSHKKRLLGQLAETCILGCDISVRPVVCVHIDHNNKQSRKATISVWRPQLVATENGYELRAVEDVADVAFRDKAGNAVDRPGLRLRLSDFAYQELVQQEMGEEDTFISIPGRKLCEYLDAADINEQSALGKHVSAPGTKKRKRAITPPEEINADDEARYVEEEGRVAKRADHGSDYDDK